MASGYFAQYLFVLALGLVALVVAASPLILARFVAPKKPGKSKQSAYECGLESTGDSWVQFRLEYYVYALLFVIFDVEAVFLFPWAMIWKGIGPIAFLEMAVFIGILAVGLAYAWKRGFLEWR